MESNHRCLGVGQESSPLDHGTVLIGRRELVSSRSLVPQFKLRQEGLNLHPLLNRQVDYRYLIPEIRVSVAGFEPALSCFPTMLRTVPEAESQAFLHL